MIIMLMTPSRCTPSAVSHASFSHDETEVVRTSSQGNQVRENAPVDQNASANAPWTLRLFPKKICGVQACKWAESLRRVAYSKVLPNTAPDVSPPVHGTTTAALRNLEFLLLDLDEAS